jgi:PAS domain S-box-containing protein
LPERDGAEDPFEDAPCGYLVVRPDGTIARVNRTFLEWTGYRREALHAPRRFQDLLTVPGRIWHETHMAPLLRLRGEVREAALDLQLEDGRTLPVLVNASQAAEADGQPGLVHIVVVEATDRRRYERELLLARRRAEQLAEVVNASGDAILITAPDGTVRVWNRGAERLFGWRADEAIGRSVGALIVPDELLEEYDRALGEAREGREAHLDTVRTDRDGRALEVSLSLTPHIEPPGEVVAISSIIRDMSERRRIEVELRRAAHLHAVGTLAGGVAHELNNQMTVVLGLGAFVRRGLGPDHPQLPDLDEMIAAGTRASSVTRQLLAFGRRQIINPVRIDAGGLARRLTPVLGTVAGEDAALTIQASGASAIRADPEYLEQLLVVLVENARDAIGAGGTVTVAIEDAALTAADVRAHPADDVVPGDYLRISVTDTGHGMDAATRARAFEPFFTTKPVGEGRGLGLSMVHGIVKQHGGQIWIESEPGTGTRVRVYLPAIPAGAEEPAAVSPRATPAAATAVLVVEDEPHVRALTCRMLEEAGLPVVGAENGWDAWERLAAGEVLPRLVLADLMMRDMNGRQLGEAIGRQWPEIPVLYTSAFPRPDVVAQGILPAEAPFLQKPFTPDELVGRVSEMLVGERDRKTR